MSRSIALLVILTLALLQNFARSQTVATSRFFRSRAQRCLSQLPLICNVYPTTGNTVTGTVLFTPAIIRKGRRRLCRARVQATIRNLSPGAHGFHIHMYGDLSADNGISTGPHFLNPRGIPVQHGFSDEAVRHWGDLDNLIAGDDGMATYNRVDRIIRLGGILGRGVTIHAEEDRGAEFQPTGNAGARVAVCTIGFANPNSL